MKIFKLKKYIEILTFQKYRNFAKKLNFTKVI